MDRCRDPPLTPLGSPEVSDREHSMPTWSTPKDPSSEAKVIRQALRACPHEPTREDGR